MTPPSQLETLSKLLPPPGVVFAYLGGIILLVFVALYYRDTSREYPHSSDPEFGKRLFWGRFSLPAIRFYQLVLMLPKLIGLLLVTIVLGLALRGACPIQPLP